MYSYAEAFKTFPVLEQLELCMCGIGNISVNHTDFASLQVSLFFLSFTPGNYICRESAFVESNIQKDVVKNMRLLSRSKLARVSPSH